MLAKLKIISNIFILKDLCASEVVSFLSQDQLCKGLITAIYND
jgi:hypothetical protein